MLKRNFAIVAALAASLLVAACGGGGSDSTSAPQVAPPAQKTAAVTSATPSTALQGDVVTITGTNLSLVTAVKIGGLAANFERVSDTQLRVTVPAGAAGGVLTLDGTGFSVSTGITVSVVGTPVVKTLSASTAVPGSTLVLTGTNLSSVNNYILLSNGTRTPLAVSVRSDGSVAITLPSTAMVGTLLLKTVSGTEIDTQQTVRVATPPQIAAISPASGLLGSQVTLTGSGLLGVSTVAFGATAEVAVTPTSDTTLTVTVPDTAQSGAIRVAGPVGSATTASSFTVIPTARVAGFQATIDVAGTAEVNLSGTNLNMVTGVTIGGAPTTLVSQSATALKARAANPAEGAVVLAFTSGQPAITAGSVVRGAGSAYTLARTEFAQQFAFDVGDSQMRLAAGRPALLRVQFVAPKAGVPLPVVSAQGFVGSLPVGTIQLNPPSANAVPTAQSTYDLGNSWWTQLPAAWVQQGLSVQLLATSGGTVTTVGPRVAPTIGGSPKITLVMVPIQTRYGGDFTGQVPSDQALRETLERAYPFTQGNVSIERRPPLDVTDLGDLTIDAWQKTINRVYNLRTIEASGTKKVYLGVMPSAARAPALAGLAFINQLSSAVNGTAAMAGLFFDATAPSVVRDPFGMRWPQWVMPLVHELGHNMSREHAPCNVSPADANYPYEGGLFGDRAVWFPETGYFGKPNQVIDPQLTMPDVMGYCAGAFFSDFNLNAVQKFAEAWSMATTGQYLLPLGAMAAPGTAEAPGTMLISGSVTADGVVFYPAVTAGAVTLGAEGPYELRLTTADGRVFTRRFAVTELGDHLPRKTAQFQVPMPIVDEVATIELFYQGAKVREDTGTKTAQSATRAMPASSAASATFAERNGELTVTWSAPSHPYLTVVHVDAQGQRTVAAMNRTGGSAVIPTASLPAGGYFELTVSSERAARRFRLDR